MSANPSAAQIGAATRDDLAEVLTWIHTADDLRLWGGPGLTFPAVVETTWTAIDAENTSYGLTNQSGELLAFGQALPRDARWFHLARVIVGPAWRGRGVGRALCEHIMRQCTQGGGRSRFTLNVYPENLTAVRLYGDLGFAECPASGSDSPRMERFFPDP